MTTALIFLAVLVPLVLIHELGHYLAARAFGVKVLEFGFFFPPRLFSIRRGETIFSINLLPLGGFVKLLGEEDPSDPRSLASKPILTRFIVLVSGSAMNILLPLVLFVVILLVPQSTLEGRVQIVGVAPESPAAMAGLRTGDIVISIDGHPVRNHQELSYRIRLNLGESTTWKIVREKYLLQQPMGLSNEPGLFQPPDPIDSKTVSVTLIPRWQPPPDEGNAGIVIATIDARMNKRSYNLFEAIPQAFQRTGETLRLFRNEITSYVIGASAPQVAGPIGIAQITGEVAQSGWIPLLELAALLSLNLAILNVLPLPPLDGGRIMFLAVEFLRRGKRISPKREVLVHAIGFAAFISLVVVISYFDIIRIVRGESLLGG